MSTPQEITTQITDINAKLDALKTYIADRPNGSDKQAKGAVHNSKHVQTHSESVSSDFDSVRTALQEMKTKANAIVMN